MQLSHFKLVCFEQVIRIGSFIILISFSISAFAAAGANKATRIVAFEVLDREGQELGVIVPGLHIGIDEDRLPAKLKHRIKAASVVLVEDDLTSIDFSNRVIEALKSWEPKSSTYQGSLFSVRSFLTQQMLGKEKIDDQFVDSLMDKGLYVGYLRLSRFICPLVTENLGGMERFVVNIANRQNIPVVAFEPVEVSSAWVTEMNPSDWLEAYEIAFSRLQVPECSAERFKIFEAMIQNFLKGDLLSTGSASKLLESYPRKASRISAIAGTGAGRNLTSARMLVKYFTDYRKDVLAVVGASHLVGDNSMIDEIQKLGLRLREIEFQ